MSGLLEGAERLPTLEGEQIRLRWLEQGDASALFEVFSDKRVMRYWSSTPMKQVSEARKLIEEIQEGFQDRKFFQWGVARREDDRVLGTCTLWNINLENRRAEVGYVLGREAWGYGFMSEALPLMVSFIFGDLDLRRLEADVDPRNEASIRILERLKFQREGFLRERWEVDGEIQDALFYGLLRSDWVAAREADRP